MLKAIFNRIYADYLMPSRMGVYKSLVQLSNTNGYVHFTIKQFFQKIISGETIGHKVFIHRHDIDSDTDTARRFFEIEEQYNIKTSYYFRLRTIDVPLMRELHSHGHEVGYHYEELSDYCKYHKVKSRELAMQHFPAMRINFSQNLDTLQNKLGFKIHTVASHGDFINRKLGINNYAMLDHATLTANGIVCECYDERLLTNYGTIISDCQYPNQFRPGTPQQAIAANDKNIYLLTHPKHWHTCRWCNTYENYHRVKEGILFRL